jgi:hypothetical protein
MRRLTVALGAVAAAAAMAAAAMAEKTVQEPSGQVFVTTVPEKAIVYCDGVPHDVSPLTITDLRPGEHLISAAKQGHTDAQRTVVVRASEKVAVELTLEPVLGLVIVHSEPAGADVEVDGAFRGKTPLLMADLPVGRHRMRISKPGHTGKEVEHTVRDRIPARISVSLTSDAASLSVESSPTGARVTVDGLSKGNAPCTTEMQPGEHTVEIAMDGYQPVRQTVRLVANRSETVRVDLKELTSEIQVVSTPPKAKVYVDDQLKGETPLTLPELAPGTYRVRVQIPGYEPMRRDVTLGRGQKVTEEFGLLSTAGTLEVSTVPAGVRVAIDGREAGTTVARTNDAETASELLRIEMLQAGKHQVELARHGYAPRSFSVTIEAGKTATVQGLRMERRFTPDYEVRTVSEVYRGVLVEKDVRGSIKLEIKPGVIMKFDVTDIRYSAPIRQ